MIRNMSHLLLAGSINVVLGLRGGLNQIKVFDDKIKSSRVCSLTYRNSPNKLLQSEDMDLLTGLELVASATKCVSELRCEAKFTELWDAVTVTDLDITSAPPKRQRTLNKNLHQYFVEETTGQKDNDKPELQRLYYSALDTLLGEINHRKAKSEIDNTKSPFKVPHNIRSNAKCSNSFEDRIDAWCFNRNV